MYFRCSSCHAGVWLGAFESTGRVAADCKACRQEYRFALEVSAEELHRRASLCATEHAIDLPGACSVALDLMTVDQVNELGRAQRAEVAPEPAVTGRRKHRFDPAFANAVRRGLLSPRQALERGKRDAYALNIARRHGISKKLAYAVADNRMPLIEAVRARGAKAPIKVEGSISAGGTSSTGPPPRTRSHGFLSASVAGVLLLGAAAWVFTAREDHLERREQARKIRESGQLALQQAAGSETNPTSAVPAAAPAKRPLGTPRIKLDESERPLRIDAGSPTAVLRAYCGIDQACDVGQPVELAPALPTAKGRRIGLFTDAIERRRWAIWIQKNHRSGRWVAGDGARPIPRVPAMDMKIGDPRISIDLRQ